MATVLTPDEVAELLRIERKQVDSLLDGGELPSFEVCGERRVFMESVMAMLGDRVNAAQAGVLGNSMSQARAMASTIAGNKALIEELAKLEASPGTFGDLLRNAALSPMEGKMTATVAFYSIVFGNSG